MGSDPYLPFVDVSGMIAVIRFLLREVEEFGGVTSHLDDRVREELSLETYGIVYRIVSECLSNIRMHAHARNVVVALETSAGGILGTVEDNGTGFDVAMIGQNPANHIGLQLMRERAEVAGGWCRVQSEPGSGTTTEFWIPSTPVLDGG